MADPVIPPPTLPSVCRVYEYCYNQAGTAPLATVTATAWVVTAFMAEDVSVSVGAVTGHYTALTGLLYWDIPYGASVAFTIVELGVLDDVQTVPSQESVRLSEI